MKFNPRLSVIIYADDYKKLADWYKKTFGLEVTDQLEMENDTYIGFMFGENYFSIGKHSMVSGMNQDPMRIMINFSVPSVSEAYEELKDKDIEFIATPFEAPPGGFHAMTMYDSERNIIQIMGGK